MADPFAGLNTFVAGQLDYIADMNADNGILSAGGILLDGRIASLEAATNLAGAADAIAVIPNLCINGDFKSTFCGPYARASNYAATVPLANSTYGDIENTQWADCWHVQQAQADALLCENQDSSFGDPSVPDPFLAGLRIAQGAAGGSPYQGTVFQRLDYFWDLDLMRGKNFVFSVNCTVATLGEFQLIVDDGVGTSTSAAYSSTGSITVRVQHSIDAAATRLVVKIVLLKDALAAAAPGVLMIHYAHARLGAGLASLTAQNPPPKLPHEMWMCQMMNFTSEHVGVTFPQSDDGGGGVAIFTHYERMQLRVPLMLPLANDLESAVYLAGVSGDVRDLAILNVPPTLSFWQDRRYSPNYPANPAPFLQLEAAEITMVRDISVDPPLVAATGFYTDEMVAMARIIPDVS